jgi:hypothetical protein
MKLPRIIINGDEPATFLRSRRVNYSTEWDICMAWMRCPSVFCSARRIDGLKLLWQGSRPGVSRMTCLRTEHLRPMHLGIGCSMEAPGTARRSFVSMD